MINKFKEKVISLNLSLRREVLFLAIGNIACLLLIIFPIILQNYILCIFVLLALLIFNFSFFYRYKLIEEKRNNENLTDFVELFNFFRIYIHNGFSVYSALKEIKNFANPGLNSKLETLIEEIDHDKTVTPFIRFAHSFNELIIEEMMISIYQMVDDGNNSRYLSQFELIFDKFSSITHEKELKNKENKLSSSSYGPLIGSGVLIIMITVGILTIIGGMVSGL